MAVAVTTTARLEQVGGISLIDLLGICEVQGRDGLPYPFWRTQPAAGPETNASMVAERLDGGDLNISSSGRAPMWRPTSGWSAG